MQETPKLRRYGHWAGNPMGAPEDGTRCVVEVWPGNGTYLASQCSRKRGHGTDGLYCPQHAKKHPATDTGSSGTTPTDDSR